MWNTKIIPGSELKLILTRYKNGESLGKLGLEFGYNRKTLGRVLERSGIKLRTQREAIPNPLNQQQEAEIVNRYQSGESATALAKAFGANHETVLNRVVLAGSGVRSLKQAAAINSKARLTEKQKVEIASLYESGLNSVQLAVKYQVSVKTIAHHLRRQGVDLRGLSEAKQKHLLNESCFDLITEESAYWIGFLMADGCVHFPKIKASPRISLVLAGWDIEHLESYRKFLCTSSPISRIKKDTNGYAVAVSSTKLATVLAKYGVTPRKSLTAKVVELENDRHFWRGVIDGDGTLSDTSRYSDLNDKKRFRVSLLGSEGLMQQFASFIEGATGVKPATHRHGNIATVAVSGKTAVKLTKVLYGDCSIALPRKLERANKIIKGSQFFIQRDCLRCGHSWTPNKNNLLPKTCAKCHSTLWNVPKATR